MRVYESKDMCCGCRACEQVCPVGCITLETDAEGFLYPVIDEMKCIHCGKCKRVCQNIQTSGTGDMSEVYAVRNRDEEVRMKSSSGGVFYELGKAVIEQCGKVYGAVFNDEYMVQHIGTDTMTGLEAMCGSKYVQSDTTATFSEAKKDLEAGRKVLYSGTPCQIAGLKSFLQKEYEELVCVSIICHGTCSPMIWKKYIEGKNSNCADPLKSVNFRDKSSGWRDLGMRFKYENEDILIEHEKDVYMRGFLADLYLRKSCHACRAKGKSQAADIILGDYWGINDYHSEIDDNKGGSAVIINTAKGRRLFSKIEMQFEVVPSLLEYVKKHNPALVTSSLKGSRREKFFKEVLVTDNIENCILNNLPRPVTEIERYWYTYPMVLEYLKQKVNGYSISDFFQKQGYQKIALYAVNDFTGIICDDIKFCGSKTEIVCISDRNYKAFENGFKGYDVVGMEKLLQLYCEKKVDCIVVCNMILENSIIKDLVESGFALENVLSINSVVFGLGGTE